MTDYFIFHGWGANSKGNWFDNTRKFLEANELNCLVPDFPNSQNPRYKDWKNHLMKTLSVELDEDSVLIGHSLGAGFIQRLLTEEEIEVKAIVLVAPTVTDCKIPEIKDFFVNPFDYEKIKEQSGKIFIFASDDDPFIPLEEVKLLGEKLSMTPEFLTAREHLWQENLPELDRILLQLQ